jgi:hypothetical protein
MGKALCGLISSDRLDGMPRKQTIQPIPLSYFNLEDGTVVEIRDWRTREIGRGADKKFIAEDLDWQVLNGLFDDLMSGNPFRENRATEALASNAALERFLFGGGYEFDERTGRRHGKTVREKYTQIRRILGAVEYDSW